MSPAWANWSRPGNRSKRRSSRPCRPATRAPGHLRPRQLASLAYRLRLLFLDRSNLWGRLTRYRTWRGPHGETLDGTNKASERAIGWWIKERYPPCAATSGPSRPSILAACWPGVAITWSAAAQTWPCCSPETETATGRLPSGRPATKLRTITDLARVSTSDTREEETNAYQEIQGGNLGGRGRGFWPSGSRLHTRRHQHT